MEWTNAIPVVGGILSTAGDIISAQQNRAEAERNRQFQERMSSTAIQRSVEDYKKAGLNPALAYERSASSPGGAQAMIGNQLEKGVSNATALAATRQAMELAKATTAADIRVKDSTVQNQTASAALAAQQASNLFYQQVRDNQVWEDYTKKAQPQQLRLNVADAILKELAIDTARFESTKGALKGDVLRWGINNAKTFRERLNDSFNTPGADRSGTRPNK